MALVAPAFTVLSPTVVTPSLEQQIPRVVAGSSSHGHSGTGGGYQVRSLDAQQIPKSNQSDINRHVNYDHVHADMFFFPQLHNTTHTYIYIDFC